MAAAQPASAVRLTPSQNWVNPQGWQPVPTRAGAWLVEPGKTCGDDFSRDVTDVEWEPDQVNSDGIYVSNWRWRRIGRALNQMLRHDRWIRVN